MYALFLSKRVTWSIYLRGGIWYYTDEKGEEVLYALIVHRHAQRLNVAASLRLRMDGSDIRERKKWRIVTRCACTIAVIACLRVCVCADSGHRLCAIARALFASHLLCVDRGRRFCVVARARVC